jgi:hypothetical protein
LKAAAEQSAGILDRLLREVAVLSSADAAARCAQERIRAKNALTASDAARVEEAFAASGTPSHSAVVHFGVLA